MSQDGRRRNKEERRKKKEQRTKKEYVGPKAKTFRSKAQAQLWANAVEGSLKRPAELDQPPPQIHKEAIDLYIEGPLQEHRSGHNEQYQLRAMANSWIGGVPLSELSIRHFAPLAR